jgi:ribosome-binding factor A
MSNRDARSQVADLNKDDGVDPKEEKKRRMRSLAAGKRDYSTLRLASQIHDVLDLALLQCGNPLLASLAVGTVEPSPTGGNFVVQVYSTDPAADYDPREIKKTLDTLKPKFRSEVANEVTRKNAPDLKFDVFPPGVQPKS